MTLHIYTSDHRFVGAVQDAGAFLDNAHRLGEPLARLLRNTYGNAFIYPGQTVPLGSSHYVVS